MKQVKQKKKSDPLVQLSYSPVENEVVTDNPHQYPSLLKMAFDKVLEFCGVKMSEEEKMKVVAENANHEFDHHAQAVGEPKLKMSYGVRFNEDLDKRSVSWQPFVGLDGKTKKSTFDRIVRGPAQKSKGDEEMLK